MQPGDRVEKGQRLAVVEAMKMEHVLVAPADGEVAEVAAEPGAQVAEGARLIVLKQAGSLLTPRPATESEVRCTVHPAPWFMAPAWVGDDPLRGLPARGRGRWRSGASLSAAAGDPLDLRPDQALDQGRQVFVEGQALSIGRSIS